MGASTKKFICHEIWGGNKHVAEDVEFGRLKGHLVSLPFESNEGGDIHFLSLCDQEMLAKIVVADVAGHGQIVSKIALELRNLLRANLNEVDNSKLLVAVNDTLRHKLREGKFVTMVAATFNGKNDDFIYAYAGHPTIFRFNSSSGRWQFLEPVEERNSGIPLGILGNTEYIQMKARLKKGDMLLFYTDGLLDVKKSSGELLNVNGLLEICQKVATDHPNPRQAATSLIKHIEESCEGGFTDDVTLLTVEVT
jgi:serine phosphatase RsbU (regulator of sigma subunit)